MRAAETEGERVRTGIDEAILDLRRHGEETLRGAKASIDERLIFAVLVALALQSEDLIAIEAHRIALTVAGRHPLMRIVAAFDAYVACSVIVTPSLSDRPDLP